jgi:serine/threonine-protein kinase
MKLIDGPSLSQLIRKEGPLIAERTVSIALRMASALEAAHRREVVHRDIKPGNILIDATGTPFLTDFGIARLQDRPSMTQTGVFVGTPYYASPEQARLMPADERSDIYSLGVVIFEMSTARRPFVADSIPRVLQMHVNDEAPDPRQFREDIPPELSRIISRCLEKAPERRYPTATDLKQALHELDGAAS